MKKENERKVLKTLITYLVSNGVLTKEQFNKLVEIGIGNE